MTSHNPVIWNEGLFIKPQHFQQQQRAFEHQLHRQVEGVFPFAYGFRELELDSELLQLGRIGIARAQGVLPDGTLFDVPGDASAPTPLTIDATRVGQTVYLALPLRASGTSEIRWPESRVQARYIARSTPLRDLHSKSGGDVSVDVAAPNLSLMLEEEDRSAFATLALCQVRDLRTDGSLVLDDAAYPTSLSLQAAPPLARYVREIATLMYERAKSIAARLASPSQSGVAEVTDFNLLQTLNRLHPVFSHLAQLPHVHPESLYCLMAQACGELATFTEASRLPEATPAYRHDLPHLAFKPLEEALRRSLGTVLQPRAIAIALHKESYGVISAPLADTQLIENAQFILAVRASLPVERLRQQFVQQAKVAARETLTELIQLQLPGIPLVPLPVAPRHLPFHAGFSYFELDQGDSAWAMMRGASGFGLHVAGELPDLELQFWAIRSE